MGRFGAEFQVEAIDSAARFLISDPDELTFQEHPWTLDLMIRLQSKRSA
jgi:hypothetical protein